MIHYIKNVKVSELENKICLLRLDFNTEDNWRMRASLPTIHFLSRNCRVTVILSHKGRPFGNAQGNPNSFDKKLSLRLVAANLKKELKKPVIFIPHFRFKEIKKLIRVSPKGSVFLLENLRFLKGESRNSIELAGKLAGLGDIYINDAFAVSHRPNASVAGIAGFLPSYAGLELEAEIKNLSRIMKNPKKPLVIILGGIKIKDKLGVYRNLKNKAETFLIGGALTPKILKLKLPKVVWSEDFLKKNGIIKDIGRRRIAKFKSEIKKAGTIVWKGPGGGIYQKQFQKGTEEIARALARNKKAFTAVGGGETVMFLKKLKLDKKMDFISTGGGAMLDFLAGQKLPGIEALK